MTSVHAHPDRPVGAARSPQRSQPPSVQAPRAATGPSLTEVVDGQRGRVTVSGHLTRQGADLLRGTVEGLRRLGHSTVVLELHDVQDADPVGLQVLHDLSATMAHAGNRLLVLHSPEESGGHRRSLTV